MVIEGRAFVVGATYAPAKPSRRCRRLVGFEPAAPGWWGGLVLTVVLGGALGGCRAGG
jgi:hypothetical protein